MLSLIHAHNACLSQNGTPAPQVNTTFAWLLGDHWSGLQYLVWMLSKLVLVDFYLFLLPLAKVQRILVFYVVRARQRTHMISKLRQLRP
jgi:hypothetical protein